MATLKHVNLFAGDDKSGVYAVFQSDYDRDTYVRQFWRVAFVCCAVGAALFTKRFDWLWLFGGLFCIERAVSSFVDNSNRNWAMHVIDWIEANQHPTE